MPAADCPLCGCDCRSVDHARQHMHTHHLKSEIIDAYVEELERDSRATTPVAPGP